MTMSKKEDKDLKIVMLPEVEADLAKDPELAEVMRDFSAMMRQAFEATERGQYKTMDDAMEAIMGCRPVKIDAETGEPIPGASMDADMRGVTIESAKIEPKKN